MANLKAIFEEDGIAGIIPYAFDREEAGYQFLCSKLKEALPFYILVRADFCFPFYRFEDEGEKMYFSVFTNKEQALETCDQLALANFNVQPFYLEHPDPNVWTMYREYGVTHICVDGFVYIDIEDLAPPCTYEGILNNQTPLRNPSFNEALYVLLQYESTGTNVDPLKAIFWEKLNETIFYVPRRMTRKLEPGEIVNNSNSDFHFLEGNGQVYLPVFSDDLFLQFYAAEYEVAPEDAKLVYTANLPDLIKYMENHPDVQVIINPVLGDVVLNRDVLEELEGISIRNSVNVPPT